jgi:ABC-type nitrate/sulfonate/bicarbonate transport system ATPase subunit
MYKQFGTDENLEKRGIELDYGDFVVTVARAGGANKKFAKVLEARSKPYRRAIQTETMDPERGKRLMQEVYAEAVILNWETRDENGELQKGIENPDGGELLPVTQENIVKTFQLLPDLWVDIQEQSGKVALFRKTILEEDSGNS